MLIDYERGRFWAWGEVLGFTQSDSKIGDIGGELDASIAESQEEIVKIQDAIQDATIKVSKDTIYTSQTLAVERDRNGLQIRALHLKLQSYNDTIQNHLSPLRHTRMEELWPRRDILGNSLQPTIAATTTTSKSTLIKLKPTAAMTYMGQLRNQRKSGVDKGLFVDKAVDITSDFGEHSLGWYEGGSGTSKYRVLVEWKDYNSKWKSKAGKELYDRIGEVAELLHNPEKHLREYLRVLNCTGWLHDEQACRFGFVYEMPEVPVSLHDLITQKRSLKISPPLGMKFKLATMISRCLLDIHTIGWLHKNISAHNIISAPREGAMVSSCFSYLTGFNHSRADDDKALTEGPNIFNKHIEYQHPKYRSSDKSRFHRFYDYYSLGLVLLEVGVWTSFSQIAMKKASLSASELQSYLIGNLAPKLDEWVGAVYREVVVTCLIGDLGSCRDETDEARKQSLAEFEQKFVQPLPRCFA